MKRGALIILLSFLLIVQACQENTAIEEFTGREYTYDLVKGSAYNVSGSVIFKEKTNGGTLVELNLTGTEGNVEHPVHLHLGDVNLPDADVAALLNPLKANSGKSETLLNTLADGSPLSYEELITLEACIKVHLSDFGPERDIILAAGNIGASFEKEVQKGRRGSIAICKSE